MLLIAKATVTFSDHGLKASGNRQHTVKPVAGAQQAPEWIRRTDTFALAIKGGQVVELGAHSPTEQVPPTKANLLSVGYSEAEADKIVEDETDKFTRGIYPYRIAPKTEAVDEAPAPGATPKPSLQKLIESGFTAAQAEEIMAKYQAESQIAVPVEPTDEPPADPVEEAGAKTGLQGAGGSSPKRKNSRA